MERLQKILSQAGIASRRASEQLMLDGRVSVNGETVTELGTKADVSRDDIRVDGRRIKVAEHHRYILVNKPAGVLATRSDPQRRPTVIDLVGVREYVYPVGRLDFESQGLLLLTNDGELAARLTHPRHAVPRVYEARVLGVPDSRDLDRLARGVEIDGRRTLPAEVVLVHGSPASAPRTVRHASPRRTNAPSATRGRDESLLRITIREGRNRQVRKMCDAIGHPVTHLARVAIGPIRDTRLKPGQWRELTADEVRRLRNAGN
ncbi:MAG TPA: pseudouridine synthase [Vicinamibacterales bacterium]|jgi:pseudouridine synthase